MSKTIKIIIASLLIISSIAIGIYSLILAINTLNKPSLGFFFGANLIISPISRINSDNNINVKAFDKIYAINKIEINNYNDLKNKIRALPANQYILLTVIRGGQKLTFPILPSTLTIVDVSLIFILPFVIGILFIIIGSILFFLKLDSTAAFLHLLVCITISIFFFTIFDNYTSFNLYRFNLMYLLFGALSIHLLTIFPTQKIKSKILIPFLVTVYTTSAIIIFFKQLLFFDYRSSVLLSTASSYFLIFTFLFDLFYVFGTHYIEKDPVIRKKLKIILIGFFSASILGIFWLLFYLIGIKFITVEMIFVLSLFFPILIGYAIFKEDIFDIDKLLRESLSYAILSAILIGLYVIFVTIVSFIVLGFFSFKIHPLFYVGATVILAYIFQPLKNLVQRNLHRLLFKKSSSFVENVKNTLHKISSQHDLDSLFNTFSLELTQLIWIQDIAIFLENNLKNAFSLKYSLNKINFPNEIKKDILFKIFRSKNTHFVDLKTVKLFDLPIYFRGTYLCLLKNKNNIFGAVWVGPKILGSPITRNDLRILDIVINHTLTTLDNLSLSREIVKRGTLAAMGEMASIIIHDIRNPLSAIKISAQTLKKKLSNEAELELVQIIDDELTRMNSAIGQILSFAKPTETLKTQFNLNNFIEGICSFYMETLKISNIDIEFSIPTQQIKINADKDKLRRIFDNLIVNAKEAGNNNRNGKIVISCNLSEADGSVVISVHDNGTGIDSKEIDNIFKPFYTTKQKGTGLGLAIVKQIVDEHGGLITINSEKNVGTTFTIKLPLQ